MRQLSERVHSRWSVGPGGLSCVHVAETLHVGHESLQSLLQDMVLAPTFGLKAVDVRVLCLAGLPTSCNHGASCDSGTSCLPETPCDPDRALKGFATLDLLEPSSVHLLATLDLLATQELLATLERIDTDPLHQHSVCVSSRIPSPPLCRALMCIELHRYSQGRPGLAAPRPRRVVHGLGARPGDGGHGRQGERGGRGFHRGGGICKLRVALGSRESYYQAE